MIKIKKHGNMCSECRCEICGCEFTYTKDDTYYDSYSTYRCRFVHCPECGHENKTNIIVE